MLTVFITPTHPQFLRDREGASRTTLQYTNVASALIGPLFVVRHRCRRRRLGPVVGQRASRLGRAKRAYDYSAGDNLCLWKCYLMPKRTRSLALPLAHPDVVDRRRAREGTGKSFYKWV